MRDPLRGLLRVCSLSLVLCLVAGWGIAAGAQPDESEEWQNDWAQVSMAMFVRTCSTPKCLGPVERYLRPSLLSFWPWQHIPAIIVLDEYVPAPNEDGERTLNAHDAANEAARTMLAEQPPFFVVKESVGEQDPLVWNTGYVRQSYSHFHADVYTDAEYVALVDTDTLFVTPVTPGDLLDDRGRPIMVVQIGRPGTEFWRATATKVEAFLKRPYLARGMANWPVVVRTEHLAALRDYVMQAHNTSFENVFEAYCAGMKECHNKIVRYINDGSRPSRCVTDTLFCCAYDVMVTYLWYFHRDSYDWHFQQFDPLWDPELLPSQMQDYSFLNESNTHPVIRTGVHVGKSGHFHFGLMPTGNAEADIWVRWNDSRYRHVDFDHVSLCCDKQILWGFCVTAVWLRQLQVLSEDEARMYACQAIFASFEAFGSEMSNHSDEGGGGGKPTLVFGRNLPLEHASLFRFEMTDWRWDARTRRAAWEHYQRILKYVKRHGWAWSMAQIDHLFDQVLLSTADEYNEFVQAECLCHLQWPLGQFRYYDQDVWQSGRPDYFTATKTKLSAYRSVGSCSMAQLSDTHQVECTSRAQVHDNDSLVVPQDLTETTSEPREHMIGALSSTSHRVDAPPSSSPTSCRGQCVGARSHTSGRTASMHALDSENPPGEEMLAAPPLMSPNMHAPKGKDRAEEAGKMPEMSAQEHQGQDLAGARIDLHGLNHPPVAILKSQTSLEYNPEVRVMILRSLICGLIPGFEYVVHAGQLEYGVYKQENSTRFSCTTKCQTVEITLALPQENHQHLRLLDDAAVFNFIMSVFDPDVLVPDGDGVFNEKDVDTDALVARSEFRLKLNLREGAADFNLHSVGTSCTEGPQLTGIRLSFIINGATSALEHLAVLVAHLPSVGRVLLGEQAFSFTTSSTYDLFFALTRGERSIFGLPTAATDTVTSSRSDNATLTLSVFVMYKSGADQIFRYPLHTYTLAMPPGCFESESWRTADDGMWHANHSKWRSWLRRAYLQGATSSMLANRPQARPFMQAAPTSNMETSKMHTIAAELRERNLIGIKGDEKHDEHARACKGFCDANVWSTPVAVMNQPHDRRRRESTDLHLKNLGFTNVTFPQTVKWTEVRETWGVMVDRGVLSPSLMARMKDVHDTEGTGYERYAANALTQIQMIQMAAAAGEPIMILEDDLMVGGDLQATRNSICRTLSNLPPSAHMIYFEFCLESCREIRYNSGFAGLARAKSPSCSAAIYFTVAGARRVADLCFPIFDVVDRMYPTLIAAGQLQAYMILPPVFYQDQFFASNWYRRFEDENRARALHAGTPLHTPLSAAVPGREAADGHSNQFDADAPVDLRQVGLQVTRSDLEIALMELEVEAECRQGQVDLQMPSHDKLIMVWFPFALPAAADCNHASRARIIVYKTLRKVRDPHAEERGQGPGQGGEEDKGSEQKRGGRVSDRDQLVEVGSWSSQYWECGALIGIGVDSECWGMHAGETCLIHATLLSESKEALETLKFSLFLM